MCASKSASSKRPALPTPQRKRLRRLDVEEIEDEDDAVLVEVLWPKGFSEEMLREMLRVGCDVPRMKKGTLGLKREAHSKGM